MQYLPHWPIADTLTGSLERSKRKGAVGGRFKAVEKQRDQLYALGAVFFERPNADHFQGRNCMSSSSEELATFNPVQQSRET
jgi:ribosomal 50S subunit-associated protein YjgA (DUF615 family)